LRNQSSGVGKVNQNGVGFGNFPDILSDLENDRNRAERLRHTAHSGCLLPDQAVTQAEIFVAAARFHMTNTQLRSHVGCIFYRFPLIRRKNNLEG
jgi:hypothetical protein